MTGSPYSKQPRRGWSIDTFVGPAMVLVVYNHGLTLSVRDHHGRQHTITRHPNGWWWVLDKAAAAWLAQPAGSLPPPTQPTKGRTP